MNIKWKEIFCLILNFGHWPNESLKVEGLKTKSGFLISLLIEVKCKCGKRLIDNRDKYELYKKENDEICNVINVHVKL